MCAALLTAFTISQEVSASPLTQENKGWNKGKTKDARSSGHSCPDCYTPAKDFFLAIPILWWPMKYKQSILRKYALFA